MRFPGKRLIEKLGIWGHRKKSVSGDAESLTADVKDEDCREPETQSQQVKVPVTAALKDTSVENDALLENELPEHRFVESKPHKLPKATIENVAMARVNSSPDIPAKKKSSASESKPATRRPTQSKNLKIDNQIITDSELAALEAENYRLKQLLIKQLKSSSRKSEA